MATEKPTGDQNRGRGNTSSGTDRHLGTQVTGDVGDKLRLLNLAEEMNCVTRACNALGYSRDSYYRFKALYDQGGPAALRNRTRRKPIMGNRVARAVETAVVECAIKHPERGQQRTASEVSARGFRVSPSGVRSIWQRYDLETRQKRAFAIAVRAARESWTPDSHQQAALANLKTDGRMAWTPGGVCFQDLIPIGDLFGLGPLWQHVLVDGYSRHAFVHIESGDDSTSPAAFLIGTVLPWFGTRGLYVDSVRVGRRGPFAGAEGRGFRTALDHAGIKLNRRLVRSGEGPDPVAAFQDTLNAEFYEPLWRQKPPTDEKDGNRHSPSLHDLNRRLSDWIDDYNHNRAVTAAACYGKTPVATLSAYLQARGKSAAD